MRRGPRPSGHARQVKPVRWSPEEWQLIETAAVIARMAPSVYVRRTALLAALQSAFADAKGKRRGKRAA